RAEIALCEEEPLRGVGERVDRAFDPAEIIAIERVSEQWKEHDCAQKERRDGQPSSCQAIDPPLRTANGCPAYVFHANANRGQHSRAFRARYANGPGMGEDREDV